VTRLDFPGLAFAASSILRDAPIFHQGDSQLLLAATSSKFIVHFECLRLWLPGVTGWTVERRGFGSPLGSLRATQDGKSSGMINKISWGSILFLGALFLFSAISPPKRETKWYIRLLIVALGIYLLYIGIHHLFF
jgi:hypothetical protein